MILQATLAFQPDLLLVDKSPAGVQDELLPTLRYLKTWHPESRLVLGMRDIEDSPEATSREWETKGIRKLHEEVYDHILLYGEREIFDPVIEYEMSRAVERKMTAVGYLGRANPTKSRETIRQELNIGDSPLILLTAGGGGDGFELFQTYLESFLRDDAERSEAHTVIVTGPLMAKRKRELLRNAAQSDHLTFLEFTQDLASYMAAADLIVSMAGYNTVREALSLGTRLLLVPRTHPRVEQLIRAERLAGRGMLRFLDPADLSPRRLADEIKISLSMSPPSVDMDFDGLERASQVISQLITDRLPSEWEMGFEQQLFAQKTLQELDL
ncbi:MAG TPA: glycosyltransferase [Anaerolineales bacterium]